MPETKSATSWDLDWVRPLALKSIVGSLVAAALVGVVSVIAGDFGDEGWRAILSVALFAGFALLSWYDADVSARRARWFGATSVAVSIYLLFAGLTKIWFSPESDFYGVPSIVGLVFVARIALLHIHLLLNIYRRFTSDAMKIVSYLTFCLVALLAVMISVPLLMTDLSGFSEPYWRAVGAVAILDALGTILVPLVHTLFGPGRPHVGTAPVGAPQGGRPLASAPATAPIASAYAGPPPATVGPAAPSAAQNPRLPQPHAYAPLNPAPAPLLLAWPRYADGRPLPATPSGHPDFTGVVGF